MLRRRAGPLVGEWWVQSRGNGGGCGRGRGVGGLNRYRSRRSSVRDSGVGGEGGGTPGDPGRRGVGGEVSGVRIGAAGGAG